MSSPNHKRILNFYKHPAHCSLIDSFLCLVPYKHISSRVKPLVPSTDYFRHTNIMKMYDICQPEWKTECNKQ